MSIIVTTGAVETAIATVTTVIETGGDEMRKIDGAAGMTMSASQSALATMIATVTLTGGGDTAAARVATGTTGMGETEIVTMTAGATGVTAWSEGDEHTLRTCTRSRPSSRPMHIHSMTCTEEHRLVDARLISNTHHRRVGRTIPTH